MAAETSMFLDDRGVTPVVGTILILGITVMGLAAVMFWGAPSIQRLQDDNAQSAVVGEFDKLQQIVTVLQVPDASRDPRVAVPGGTLSLEPGTRFLVAAGHDPDSTYNACDLVVTGWEQGTAAADTVTVSSTGACRGGVVEVHRVNGARTTEVGRSSSALPVTMTVAGVDFTQGDWLFRLTNGATPVPAVYAQAWLLSSDRVAWDLQSSVGERGVYLDGGAVYSQSQGTFFMESAPPIHEGAFGTDVYAFFLRTVSANQYESFSGQGNVRLFLGLAAQSARIATDDAYIVRYSFEGELAEAWCNSLQLRNVFQPFLADGPAEYVVDGSCAADIPSVIYETPDTPFTFHFIHGDIRTSILR